MSATYVKSPDSAVHVVSQAGDGEFTFCDRVYGEEDKEGFVGNTEGFYGVDCSGPATCLACKETVDEFRASVKGVRWGTREERPA